MLVSAIIKQAMRSAGVLDAGHEPTPLQSEAALDVLNTLQRSMFGVEIGPRLDAQSLTASTTGVYGASYQCVLGAAGTLTFPSNPQPGWRIGYNDAAANFGTYNLTLNPGSRLISTAAGTYQSSNVTVSTNKASASYFYREDAGWTLEQDWALTDTPYFPVAFHAALADLLALMLHPQYSDAPPANLVANAQRGRDVFMERYNPRAMAARARQSKAG
ncbi:MAG: hypothetical protein ACOY4K_00545 [Pseudomonadota bacterium]